MQLTRSMRWLCSKYAGRIRLGGRVCDEGVLRVGVLGVIRNRYQCFCAYSVLYVYIKMEICVQSVFTHIFLSRSATVSAVSFMFGRVTISVEPCPIS